jgi:hypothetical protein
MADRRSHVAAVLSPDGGVRVVVTARKSDFARHHRQPGERIIIVPNLLVEEPVPWDKIPWVIRQAERALWQWIRERNEPLDAVNNYLARMMQPQGG